MRGALAALLLALGAAWSVTADSRPSKPKPVPIKLLGPGNSFPGQVWGQTYFPPLLSFRVRSGEPPKGELGTLCDVVTEHREAGEHKFAVITLHCEQGLNMELEGIDLTGGGQ